MWHRTQDCNGVLKIRRLGWLWRGLSGIHKMITCSCWEVAGRQVQMLLYQCMRWVLKSKGVSLYGSSQCHILICNALSGSGHQRLTGFLQSCKWLIVAIGLFSPPSYVSIQCPSYLQDSIGVIKMCARTHVCLFACLSITVSVYAYKHTNNNGLQSCMNSPFLTLF